MYHYLFLITPFPWGWGRGGSCSPCSPPIRDINTICRMVPDSPYLLVSGPSCVYEGRRRLMQLFAATVRGNQLNAELSVWGFLAGSRQRLLQTVAQKVAQCIFYLFAQCISFNLLCCAFNLLHLGQCFC